MAESLRNIPIPVTIYDVEQKKAVAIFQSMWYLNMYLFNKPTIVGRSHVTNGTIIKAEKNPYKKNITLRYANKEHRALMNATTDGAIFLDKAFKLKGQRVEVRPMEIVGKQPATSPNHGNRKLFDEEDVLKMYMSGEYDTADIADKHNINKTTVLTFLAKKGIRLFTINKGAGRITEENVELALKRILHLSVEFGRLTPEQSNRIKEIINEKV